MCKFPKKQTSLVSFDEDLVCLVEIWMLRQEIISTNNTNTNNKHIHEWKCV